MQSGGAFAYALPMQLSRTGFLAAAAGLALAPGAALAASPSDADLANARLLVAIELLLLDFYGRASKAGRFGVRGRDALSRARFNEQEHLAAVSLILTNAGQEPATAADIDFSYPRDAFASVGKTAAVGRDLERLAAGAYLGAVASAVDRTLALPLARIAASEAQHLSIFEQEATGHGLGRSFPDVLTIQDASDSLAGYTG